MIDPIAPPIRSLRRSRELLIPFALDVNGTLTGVHDAIRTEQYICPGCRELVRPRAGTNRVVRHFAHVVEHTCDGETLLHQVAKLLIKQTVERVAIGSTDSRLILHTACPGCSTSQPVELNREQCDGAALEFRVGRFICDVVLLRSGVAVLAIEVRVSHAVDDAKAEQLGIPFVELGAEQVLESPWSWHPLRARSLRERLCQSCRDWLGAGVSIAQRCFIEASHYPGYLPAATACYRCCEEIPVFWWPDAHFAKAQPPSPRPPTIQWRYSRTLESSYWANTCPHCHAIQGDHFLYSEPEGPFFAINAEELLRRLADFRADIDMPVFG